MDIAITGSIAIFRDVKTTFDYIANLENDKFWRKEIHYTTMASKPQINVLATEDSFLAKRRPNSILTLRCTTFTENKLVIYPTEPKSKFFLSSTMCL